MVTTKPNIRFACCRLIIALLLASALCISACDRQAETIKCFEPEKIAELDALVKKAMDGTHAPGALVGIWKGDGTILVKAYGLANVASGQSALPYHAFRIGSITKTFTAHLILQLADAGILSLDDPVSNFVAGIPSGDVITVRRLLGNTSGIADYNSNPAFSEAFANEPHRLWTPRELVEYGIALPPYFPPGQQCRYSNTNFILLGMIIEKATGRTFGQELASRITGPLHMRSTYLAKGNGLSGNFMHGYMYDEAGGMLEDVTDYADASVYWTAGALVSTLGDLRVWGRALATGRLISKTMRTEMTAVLHELPGTVEAFGYPTLYGLGIMNMGGWLGHSGMPIGFSSAMFYLPTQNTILVTMFNLSSGIEPGMHLFMQSAKIFFPKNVPW